MSFSVHPTVHCVSLLNQSQLSLSIPVLCILECFICVRTANQLTHLLFGTPNDARQTASSSTCIWMASSESSPDLSNCTTIFLALQPLSCSRKSRNSLYFASWALHCSNWSLFLLISSITRRRRQPTAHLPLGVAFLLQTCWNVGFAPLALGSDHPLAFSTATKKISDDSFGHEPPRDGPCRQ